MLKPVPFTGTAPPKSQRYSRTSTLPTVHASIHSNIPDITRLAKELEGCCQTFQKVVEVQRYSSCPSGLRFCLEKTKRSNTYDNKATKVVDDRLALENNSAGSSIDTDEMDQSVYELLEVAQQNLYLAILAKEQYELICRDLSISLDVEEKMAVTRAKQLTRKSKEFEKMTEDAIQKLKLLNICSIE